LKILFALSRFPYPLDKGDKLRAYHQIKELSKKHEIILFSISDSPVSQKSFDHLKQYCTDIKIVRLSKASILSNLLRGLFNRLPLQVNYFYSNSIQNDFDSCIEKHQPDHLFCQLIRTAELAKTHPGIASTLDYMDVFSKGIERRMTNSAFYLKLFLKLELKRVLEYERHVFNFFKNKIIISEQDKEHILHPDKAEIKIIPNGVDTTYFVPEATEGTKDFEIIFNGNMNYAPNIESAEYLVKSILPLVQKKYPSVRLLISGATPSPKVKKLKSNSVQISGWVDDIRKNFYRSKILVAPMHISTGLQNKLLEAMAMQIPCITSSLANNALGAEDNKSILLAETPEEYAKKIIYILENETEAKKIALNGYHFVLQNYNWKVCCDRLEKIILS
jgi:sugar transferase (PEP-CTERM/EpsH1 system associated)